MLDFLIADYFYKISSLTRVFEGENYRAKAFYKAALAIDGYGKNIYNLHLKNDLRSIPAVGTKIEKYIQEIIQTGKLSALQDLKGNLPETIFDIINLPHLNHKTIRKIIDKKIYSLDELKEYIDSRKYADGDFKETEVTKIANSILKSNSDYGKFQLGHADSIGNEIVAWLRRRKAVLHSDISGAVRRRAEIVKEIHILCCPKKFTDLKRLFRNNRFLSNIQYNSQDRLTAKTFFGIPVIIDFVNDEHYYFELFRTTGPVSFVNNIIGNSLNVGELVFYCRSEKEVFDKFGADYYIPEMREFDCLTNLTPRKQIIKEVDFNGDLHVHTNWSDGLDEIETIAEIAREKGFKYLAICDHSVSLKVANGLSQDALLKQIETIKEFNNNSRDFKLIAGAEVDIKSDGTLDYPDYILSQLDFVVASIHTNLKQSRKEINDRIRRALSNEYVNVFAHPTGRLIGKPGKVCEKRSELEIDFDELLNICRQNNVALEINAFPERLDLDKEKVLMAINNGVKVSIGTDSHSYQHLDLYKYGISIARGAAADKKDVLNTYTYEQLIQFFKAKRPKEVNLDSNIVKGARDFYFYFGNNRSIIKGEKTIVGIDLTASSKKASGWAYLQSNVATTKLLGSDDELINVTLEYKPDIISIDSPLSLPEGRCCVSDKCTCRAKGIMRYCEKTLMRMGIGVFPCLLPSMVGLTERGIRLSKTFKDMGYEVIESYPGAAQDILKISRKKKGLENLIRGLKNFGIIGDIDKQKIVHDEVDAITSALVGYFYLNDQFIPLGNKEEDFLIVPRVQSDTLNKRLIIGLAGETASGKTTLAEFLRFKYGFKYRRYSQVIEQMLGNKATKEQMQTKGLEISQSPNLQRQLSLKIIETMDANTSYVIDGLRHLEDFYTLKEHFNEDFYLIFIDTNFNKRYKRYLDNLDSAMVREKFLELSSHEVELNIPLLAMKTVYRIDNNKGFVDMFRQADSILADILNRRRLIR